jgi:mRNA interferase RelE/StbE
MPYEVKISPAAIRKIKRLPREVQAQFVEVALSLRDNPRPPGSKKLKINPGYRLRFGNYRIVYQVDDANQSVIVLIVGHRKEVYRSD